MVAYDDLYVMVGEAEATVEDCWDGEEWYVDFIRRLAIVALTPGTNDTIIWALKKSRMFSTKSLYRFITNKGMASRVAVHIWKCRIPLKIKIFLWQMFNNK